MMEDYVNKKLKVIDQNYKEHKEKLKQQIIRYKIPQNSRENEQCIENYIR